MTLKSRETGDVLILDASGKLTLGEASSAVRDAVRKALADGKRKLILNLADVNYVDSAGIGELVSAFTSVTNQGGEMRLLKVSNKIKDVLQITKLYTVFQVYDDEQAALASFSKGSATGR